MEGEAHCAELPPGLGDQPGDGLGVHLPLGGQAAEDEAGGAAGDHHLDVALHRLELQVGVDKVPGPRPHHGEAGDGHVGRDDLHHPGGGSEAALRQSRADLGYIM